jgi:hypothetical protein
VAADVSGAKVTIASSAVWTGKQIRPTVTVALNGAALTSGVDYNVSYGPNKAIGKGTVVVRGAGAGYKGIKSLTFNIKPKAVFISKLAIGKRLLKVKWDKAASAQKLTGYQLQYRIKGSSKWSKVKAVTAKRANYALKKLKKNKKYEVRIRAYSKIAGGVSKGTYYGAWTVKSSGKVK